MSFNITATRYMHDVVLEMRQISQDYRQIEQMLTQLRDQAQGRYNSLVRKATLLACLITIEDNPGCTVDERMFALRNTLAQYNIPDDAIGLFRLEELFNAPLAEAYRLAFERM